MINEHLFKVGGLKNIFTQRKETPLTFFPLEYHFSFDIKRILVSWLCKM